MPKKIRELKAMLRKAGFTVEPGKGSHTNWTHPKLPGKKITVAGRDGGDAKTYQERLVTSAIREAEENE